MTPEEQLMPPEVDIKEQLRKRLIEKRPDYDGLYKEIAEYTIELKEEPTLDEINKELALVQGYKNRVCKLLLDSIKNLRVYKKMYGFLFDKEIVNTEGKSDTIRAANVNNIIRDFYDAEAEAKDYDAALRLVYENLISANTNVSRQITVVEDQLKIQER